jgi:MoaA/NifB/PqqE/SkfB family radical SAM enzyme
MITYYPWSKEVLEECLSGHDRGELTTLDLEFTAKCTTASCIYCDSRPEVGNRHPHELNFRHTEKLIRDAKKLGLRWIYACGLGEPLEDSRFEKLVELAAQLEIRLSIFTNGVLIDKEKAKWLHDNKVSLLLKLDTFNRENFDKILGIKGTAIKIYNTINLLLDAGYGKNCKTGYTDLAFSIVPTAFTINDIDDVIVYAKKNNIFPSIGELEQSGRSSGSNYANLALNHKQMDSLKKKVDELLWEGYTRPICPTIITGVHIDNVGNCIVDQETGLNCKWFLLGEPMEKELGSIREKNFDLAKIFKDARIYRADCFNKKDNGVHRYESTKFVFGGCGGNPQEIIPLARDHLYIKQG